MGYRILISEDTAFDGVPVCDMMVNQDNAAIVYVDKTGQINIVKCEEVCNEMWN